MPFVRTRKSDSDFARARRQQDFVIASIRRVINRGSGGALDSLVHRASGELSAARLETNVPLTGASALELYQRLSGTSVGIEVVLSPPKYATHLPGGTAYELNLAEVRQLAKDWFGGSDTPPGPPATTLPSAPPPGPTSGPTAMPSPGPTGAPTSAGETTGPTNSPIAQVSTPSPASSAQPTSAAQPASSPSGESGLPAWTIVVAVVLLAGVVAAGLIWRRSRRVR
jgi:hypothetical protein